MKKIYYLLVLLLLIFVFWNTPLLYPLKLLVVFFHESSHALATLFSGGKVTEMVIVPEEGGYVVSGGGNRFIILNAGYLGSLLWGALIYLFAARTRVDKMIIMILGLGIGIMTVVFVSNLFALVFGLLTAAAMMASGKYLSETVNDFLLRTIGLTNMVYVPFDIFSDTIQRSELNSDARMLAGEYGGFTMLWGTVWIVVSIITIFICLRHSIKYGKN